MAACAAGCGGNKAGTETVSGNTAATSASGKASADEAPATTAAKTKKKIITNDKNAQSSESKIPPTTNFSPGAVFSNLNLLFERSGNGWGAYLRVNPDGSFSLTYQKTTKSKTANAAKEVETSAFTGRFSDITKLNSYSYSMRITNVKFKEKAGTKKQNNTGNYTYTNATMGLEEGSTVYLYTPDALVKALHPDFTRYARVPKGIPNGDKLGGYCFRASDGKPYYSQNK